MRRTLVTAATLVALAAPTDAFAGQLFLFDRTSAVPNERVTIQATAAAVHRSGSISCGRMR